MHLKVYRECTTKQDITVGHFYFAKLRSLTALKPTSGKLRSACKPRGGQFYTMSGQEGVRQRGKLKLRFYSPTLWHLPVCQGLAPATDAVSFNCWHSILGTGKSAGRNPRLAVENWWRKPNEGWGGRRQRNAWVFPPCIMIKRDQAQIFTGL